MHGTRNTNVNANDRLHYREEEGDEEDTHLDLSEPTPGFSLLCLQISAPGAVCI